MQSLIFKLGKSGLEVKSEHRGAHPRFPVPLSVGCGEEVTVCAYSISAHGFVRSPQKLLTS